MAHAADGVVDFVVTTLTGLTTTGSNVFRRRVYDVPDANLPALIINMGADTARGDSGRANIAYIDSDLEVNIVIMAKDSDDLDGTLLDIRAEIDAAFSTAYATKPATVLDYWWVSASEPETAESDTRKGAMGLVYNFAYRRAQ